MDAHAIRHEPGEDGGVFLMDQDGAQVGELYYDLDGRSMVITHTEVARRLRGKGLAQALVDRAAGWAREQNLKIRPRCSYARIVLARSAAHRDLVE
jgi:predicted GNAT family acetyltransferase